MKLGTEKTREHTRSRDNGSMHADYLTDPYTEVYDCRPDIPPLELIDTVLERSFSLPHKSIQTPIMKACIASRSKYTSILPLVVAYGATGTGKSQLGKLVAGLYQLPENQLLAGKTTPTAIRNLIQAQKYGEDWMEEGTHEEDNALIIWDDINMDVLKDAVLLSILKSGYSRKTASIAIANAGGTNMYFNCYAMKFTSTIHPFWSYDEYVELKRRILVFPHAPYEDFNEFDRVENKRPEDLIDLDYVSFSGYRGMKQFELDNMELAELGRIRRSLRQKLRFANLPTSFSKLCFELMAVGCLWGIFKDTTGAIAAFEEFYSLQEVSLAEKSEFDYWLDRHLAKIVEQQSKLTQVCIDGDPVSISRASLSGAIDAAIKAAEIPPNRYQIADVMRRRGWALKGDTTNIFIKHVNQD